MKNTKAIFFIILGAFLMATGFAFAGEAMDQLRSGPFGTPASVELTPVDIQASNLNKALPTAVEVKKPDQKAVPEVAKAAEVKEEPKPTFGEKVKEFFGKYRRDIFRTGISAFIGFALIGGPAGLLIGALVGFAFFYMAGMSAVGSK